MTCPIHNVEMKQLWRRDDPNHVGQSWYSHKLEDGTWCNGKLKDAVRPNPAPTQAKPSEVDWDSIAVGKVASNIVNELVGRGLSLKDIKNQLDDIFDLAQAICRYKPDIPF